MCYLNKIVCFFLNYRNFRLVAHAELLVTYTSFRALLQLTIQLTIQLTNLTNHYQTILTHHNNPYHNALCIG